jgi:hypothetical protein
VQKAYDVGSGRYGPTLPRVFAYRGTPDDVAALQDKDVLTSFCEVRRRDKAIMPRSYDDGIVFHKAAFGRFEGRPLHRCRLRAT